MIHIPETMAPHVMRIFAGEYDFRRQVVLPKDNPVIVDIGANVGGFSIWAKYVWPHAVIHAFEPIRVNYQVLSQNIQQFTGIHAYQVALGAPRTDAMMYYGKNNTGECSLFQFGEQREDGERVDVVSPVDYADLFAAADILKVDCEGAELEILSRIATPFNPSVVMVEYHNEGLRRAIDELLVAQDYSLLNADFWTVRSGGTSGMVKYAHLLPPDGQTQRVTAKL